jgi:hypothetical protein
MPKKTAKPAAKPEDPRKLETIRDLKRRLIAAVEHVQNENNWTDDTKLTHEDENDGDVVCSVMDEAITELMEEMDAKTSNDEGDDDE